MADSNQATSKVGERNPALAKLTGILANQSVVLVLVLAVLGIVFASLESKFLTTSTASNILTDWGSVVLIAVGQTLVVISGGIDLSVGAIIGLSGVVAAKVMTDLMGGSSKITDDSATPYLLVGTLVSVAVGALVGLVNALLINKVRIVPFIATLSTMGACLGLSVILSNGMPVGGPANFMLISAMDPKLNPLSWAVLVVILVVVVVGLFQHKARFGTYVYAIGSNSFAARAAGINVERHITKIYALSGALAGLAGMYVYLRLGAGSPSSGTGRELDAIAAVVIGGAALSGGVGRILGTALGAIILFEVQSGLIMIGVDPNWKKVVVAILIAAAVAAQTLQKSNRR